MFKLRTFRYGGGCLQKQERCCRACDSQINPRLYDSTEARERDGHCSVISIVVTDMPRH